MDIDPEQPPRQPAATASFIKRSRPRGGGLRTKTSTLDPDQPAPSSSKLATAHFPTSSSPPTAASNRAGSISLEHDDEDLPGAQPGPSKATLRVETTASEEDPPSSSVVFRSRNRGPNRSAAGPSAVSTTTSSSVSRQARKPTSFSAMQQDDDEHDDQEEAFQIRRSTLASNGREARRRQSDKRRLLAPNTLSLDQASIVGEEVTPAATTSYSSSYLAELKASTPSFAHSRRSAQVADPGTEIPDPMRVQVDQVLAGDDVSQYRSGRGEEAEDDDDEGAALIRRKFGLDSAQHGIPSESMIRAAKEKRERMRRQARQGGLSGSAGEDFISLGAGTSSSSRSLQRHTAGSGSSRRDDGPHPDSRLQREEDEYGSGEEEFAEYTGATERIPIGKKAEQEYRAQQRREMEEAVSNGRTDYGFGSRNGNGDLNAAATSELPLQDGDEEMDSDEQEWEQAQLRRTEMPGQRQRQEAREKSPYRPAEIPLTAPLPTMTSTSARLARRIKDLEESAESHAAVVRDAEKGLETLDLGERENKEEVVQAEDKESWFRELEEFVISIAGFMEEKTPKLDQVEKDFLEVLVERTRLVERARAKAMEDDLALFWGVPSVSILPPFEAREGAEETGGEVKLHEPLPVEDGDYQSAARVARRSDATLAAQVSTSSLSPADQAALEVAQRGLSTRLDQIWSDVQAPEYLDAAARLSSKGGRLHPSSVVSRFTEWRSRYPIEYSQTWGGLAIASIWEWYARVEMLLSDPLGGQTPLVLERCRWHAEVVRYTDEHAASQVQQHDGTVSDGPMGGDEEVMMTVVQNVVVSKLVTLAESRAYDPWDVRQTGRVLKIVEEVEYVLDRTSARFQTLLSSYLRLFHTHIHHLDTLLSSDPRLRAPPFHPETPDAALRFAMRLVETLLRNLVAWSRFISPKTETLRTELLALLDRLVGSILWRLCNAILEVGAEQVASTVVQLVPVQMLAPDVRSRFEAVVRNSRS